MRLWCIIHVGGALCGRPLEPETRRKLAFFTALSWLDAADPNGCDVCGECLSVIKHALEQSENANRRRGGIW